MYRGVSFHAFSSDYKWDQSSAVHYIIGFNQNNIIPSMVNVLLQRSESCIHCNLLPVHYSCLISIYYQPTINSSGHGYLF